MKYKYIVEQEIEIDFSQLKFEIIRVIGEESTNNEILTEFINDPDLYFTLAYMEAIDFDLNPDVYSNLLTDFKNYLNGSICDNK